MSENDLFTAGVGPTVFVPPHVPHAFANCGEGEATVLLTLSPSDHDRCFGELAEILAVDGPPDPTAMCRAMLSQRRGRLARDDRGSVP